MCSHHELLIDEALRLISSVVSILRLTLVYFFLPLCGENKY